jgi:peptide/nickel transport system permease protein
MFTLITRRLLQLIPTIFFVSVLIFLLQQLLPGDPALVMAGEEKDPEVIEQIRKRYRLDQPLPIQYLAWVGGVFRGDLGESMRLSEPVATLVAQKLPVTVQLAVMAMIFTLGIGIPAGIVSAVKKDTTWDYVVNVVALWGISTPNFWLGIMMIFLFSVQLGWLPASGYVSPFEDFWASMAATIMPAFVLGNSASPACMMRHTRAAMLHGAGERLCTHRARQGAERARGDLLKHALRNALIAGDHARRDRVRPPAGGPC